MDMRREIPGTNKRLERIANDGIRPYPRAVADRGVSGPWGPQFCGALCYGETQRLPAGGAGSPPVGPRQSPGDKHILATI